MQKAKLLLYLFIFLKKIKKYFPLILWLLHLCENILKVQGINESPDFLFRHQYLIYIIHNIVYLFKNFLMNMSKWDKKKCK